MKKIILSILFIFLMLIGTCQAAQIKVLVLPTDMFDEQPYHMIFNKSASLIATDIINYYNKNPLMTSVSINQITSYLDDSSNVRLKKEVIKLFQDYERTFTINFSTLQKLASKFGVNKVLLISCNLDSQNYVTRRTLWDFLDIPGATVIDPAYRISTLATLVDSYNQVVLWQNNYQKLISSRESRIIPGSMTTQSEQLEKVKKYSTKFIAPQVVQETQLAMLNISPYQNLNLNANIVKPQAISIDKIKLDSKRASVRSGRYLQKQSINAANSTKAGTKKFVNNRKNDYENFKVNQAKRKELNEKLKIEKQKQKIIDAEIKKKQREQKVIEAKEAKVQAKQKAIEKKVRKNSVDINSINPMPGLTPPETQTKQEVPLILRDKSQEIRPMAPLIKNRPSIKEPEFTINDL